MKNAIAAIAILMFAGQVQAGSYNYECNAVRVSSQGEIQTLKMSNFGGSLNGKEITSSGDLFGEGFEIELKNKKKLAANIKVKSVIRDYNGKMGAREHVIYAFVADINVTQGGKVAKFTGTCVEEVVTTCGGDCVEMGE